MRPLLLAFALVLTACGAAGPLVASAPDSGIHPCACQSALECRGAEVCPNGRICDPDALLCIPPDVADAGVRDAGSPETGPSVDAGGGDASDGATEAGAGTDGAVEAGACDSDGDGHRAIRCGGDDCDDGNDLAYPGAHEICDGIDENCDRIADGTPGAATETDRSATEWCWYAAPVSDAARIYDRMGCYLPAFRMTVCSLAPSPVPLCYACRPVPGHPTQTTCDTWGFAAPIARDACGWTS